MHMFPLVWGRELEVIPCILYLRCFSQCFIGGGDRPKVKTFRTLNPCRFQGLNLRLLHSRQNFYLWAMREVPLRLLTCQEIFCFSQGKDPGKQISKMDESHRLKYHLLLKEKAAVEEGGQLYSQQGGAVWRNLPCQCTKDAEAISHCDHVQLCIRRDSGRRKTE